MGRILANDTVFMLGPGYFRSAMSGLRCKISAGMASSGKAGMENTGSINEEEW